MAEKCNATLEELKKTSHLWHSDCTTSHRHAMGQTCRICAVRSDTLSCHSARLGELSVADAGTIWNELRETKNLRARTLEFDRYCRGALVVFFQGLPLRQVNAGHLREYQLARKANDFQGFQPISEQPHPWKRKAGHSAINHEINWLKGMMEHAGLWRAIAPWYTPLPVSAWSPREIPDRDEERHLFQEAARAAEADPQAALAYYIAVITNNTTASGCELRGLRLEHLHLFSPVEGKRSEVYIPREAVKNNARPRKIPLNDSARWAFEKCYQRALELGCCRADHYLFPLRVGKKTYDPTRPASRSWLRKAWLRLREATGFATLSPHDLRHLCITRMLEAGVEPEIVRSVAGHVSQHMMEYYSHIRIERKADALDRIDSGSTRGNSASRRQSPVFEIPAHLRARTG